MKKTLLSFLLLVSLGATVHSQELARGDSSLTVMLLGTAGGPTFSAQRHGISTLVLAGSEKLLVDCGHGMTAGMSALAIDPADVTKVFLTHLHSDHVISLPELYLFPWASQGRSKPLQVWGAEGHKRDDETPAGSVRIRHSHPARRGREVLGRGHQSDRNRYP